MNSLDSTFPQRLTWVVEQSGKSRAAFARAILVGDTTLKNYMSGETEPGVKELIAICEVGGDILLPWLITGIGPRNLKEVRESGATYGEDPRKLYPRDLVVAVVKAMEEEIQAAGIELIPAKRADLVNAFCLLFKSADKIDREAMRMMLRATV